MRKLLLTVLFSLFVVAAPATGFAQSQQVDPDGSIRRSQQITSEDLLVYGIGALAGVGVGYLLLDAGVFPALELVGLTETTLSPLLGAIVGGVLSYMGYLDKAVQAAR